MAEKLETFDFERTLTVVLPGAIVATGVGLLITSIVPRSLTAAWIRSIATTDGQLAIVLVLASSFFGTLCWSLGDWIEETWLDPRATKYWRLSHKEYWRQFYAYTDLLADKINPHMTRRMQLMFFCLRTGAATCFLGLAVVVWARNSRSDMAIGALTTICGVIVFRLGMAIHLDVAGARNRRFGSPAG